MKENALNKIVILYLYWVIKSELNIDLRTLSENISFYLSAIALNNTYQGLILEN